MKVPISVLIPAKNESSNISACLKSVEWAGEVIVVDSNSQDGTIELAQQLGASVVQFKYELGGLKKKNWALQTVKFRYPWVLILDADERITEELAREIQLTLSSNPPQNGFYLNRKFWFRGRWIMHAGYFPSWNLRLIKLGCGKYEMTTTIATSSGDNEVHEHMIVEGRVGQLKNSMEHYAYPDIATFIEKHNRYSNWESRVRTDGTEQLGAGASDAAGRSLTRRRKIKAVARALPFPGFGRFVFHYIIKLGFLDGEAGYVLCRLLSQYEFWINLKATEFHLQTQFQRPKENETIVHSSENTPVR